MKSSAHRVVSAVWPVLGLAVALVFIGANEARADARCTDSPGPPRIELRMDAGPLAYDHGLDRTAIRSILRQDRGGTAGIMAHPVGLTRALFEFGYATTVRPVRLGNTGLWCLWLVEVEAEARYREMTVYIAREYPRGSCPYRAILDHENEHVRINREVLERFRGPFRERLREVAHQISPVVSGDPQRDARRFSSRLEQGMRPVLDAFEQERARANARIDTRESYAAIRAQCRDW